MAALGEHLGQHALGHQIVFYNSVFIGSVPRLKPFSLQGSPVPIFAATSWPHPAFLLPLHFQIMADCRQALGPHIAGAAFKECATFRKSVGLFSFNAWRKSSTSFGASAKYIVISSPKNVAGLGAVEVAQTTHCLRIQHGSVLSRHRFKSSRLDNHSRVTRERQCRGRVRTKALTERELRPVTGRV